MRKCCVQLFIVFIESGTPADGMVPLKLRDLHCSLGSSCTCSSVRLQQVGQVDGVGDGRDAQRVGERREKAGLTELKDNTQVGGKRGLPEEGQALG